MSERLTKDLLSHDFKKSNKAVLLEGDGPAEIAKRKIP